MKKQIPVTFFFMVLVFLFFSCSDHGSDNRSSSNSSPVAYDQSLSVRINYFVDIELKAGDSNNDPITYFINSQTDHGTLLQLGLSRWRYVPETDYEGLDSFTFRVNDGFSDSNTATVKINVSIANHPPVAFDRNANTDENVPVDILLTANDVDGDDLFYSIIDSPQYGTLSSTIDNNTWTYTPDTGFSGLDSFTFTAHDGFEESETAAVFIIVGAIPEPPIAHYQNIITDEDTPAEITLSGENTLNTELTYTIATYPLHGTFSLNGEEGGPHWRYLPHENFYGSDTFTFYVNNRYEDSEPVSVDISVTSVNDAPVTSSFEIVTNRDIDDPFEFYLNCYDPDGDELTYRAIAGTGPSNGFLNQVDGNLFSYRPDTGFTGTDSFQYGVTDSHGSESNISKVTIVVKQPGIIFVNESAAAAGDGTSWSRAFRTIKDAAVISLPGDEIWVAGGTYTKKEAADTVVLTMKDGVKVYGGFDGISYQFEERDPVNNRTILDGENSVSHVVTGSKQAMVNETSVEPVLDGFIIRNGNATGSGNDIYGGGLYNPESASLTVSNSTFINNRAMYGAGIYNSENTAVTISACTFDSNEALFNGGGIYTGISSSSIIEQCSFISNRAALTGGGVLNMGISAVNNTLFQNNYASLGAGFFNNTELTSIINSRFINNNSLEYAGGLYNNGGITLSNCDFTGNSSKKGGALYNNASGIINYTGPVITGCHFENNTSTEKGGAMCNDYGAPQIVSSTFRYNSSLSGGAVYNLDSNAVFTQCAFSSNSSSASGGVIDNSGSNIEITYCTFTGNSSSASGGVIDNSDSNIEITYCAFTGNSSSASGGVIDNSDSNIKITYCSFTGNSVAENGGVIYNDESSQISVINSLVENNSANLGGAVFNHESSIKLVNCLIATNTGYNGASVYNSSGTFEMYNVTVAGNSNQKINSILVPGGIIDAAFIFNNGVLVLKNTLVWNTETADRINQYYNTVTSSIDNSYSYLYSEAADDPLFLSGYYLNDGSPCIDAGDPATGPDILDILNGKTTDGSTVDVPGSRVDIGYHYDL